MLKSSVKIKEGRFGRFTCYNRRKRPFKTFLHVKNMGVKTFLHVKILFCSFYWISNKKTHNNTVVILWNSYYYLHNIIFGFTLIKKLSNPSPIIVVAIAYSLFILNPLNAFQNLFHCVRSYPTLMHMSWTLIFCIWCKVCFIWIMTYTIIFKIHKW